MLITKNNVNHRELASSSVRCNLITFRAVDSNSNSSSSVHAGKKYVFLNHLNKAFSWEFLERSFHPVCGSSYFTPENTENE